MKPAAAVRLCPGLSWVSGGCDFEGGGDVARWCGHLDLERCADCGFTERCSLLRLERAPVPSSLSDGEMGGLVFFGGV